MKQYYVKETILGSTVRVNLEASTLEEAKNEVQHYWANSGKKKVFCATYKKIKEKEYIIDTDLTNKGYV